MSGRKNRLRRPASPKQLRVLRSFGWRFSTTRNAWVHRSLKGRFGPVFLERESEGEGGVIDLRLFDAMVASRQPRVVVPEHERSQLPRRAGTVQRAVNSVEVRLDATDEPRTVLVDGRPPHRGDEPRSERNQERVVVPIKSARASA